MVTKKSSSLEKRQTIGSIIRWRKIPEKRMNLPSPGKETKPLEVWAERTKISRERRKAAPSGKLIKPFEE